MLFSVCQERSDESKDPYCSTTTVGSIEKGRTDMTTRVKKPIRAARSSGNVFADLGLPHPEQELLKAKLTLQIYRLIKERGLRQAEAGRILGIKQPHVSALMRNCSGAFSLERLMDFLTALGQDVKITVDRKSTRLNSS